MSLRAYPPGTRKGNRTYIFRGRIAGKDCEVTTDFDAATSARVIQRAKATAERKLYAVAEASRQPGRGKSATFAQAATQYLKLKDPDKTKRWLRLKIDKLLPELGQRDCGSITSAELTALAIRLNPNIKPASRSDAVIIPAAAVIHFAAHNGWCPWIKIAQFERPKPRVRAVSDEIALTLMNSLPEGSPEWLFMRWLFRQGSRVSDVCAVRWDQIDLRRQSVTMRIEKSDEENTKALHPEVFEALAAIPEAERGEYLFPWRHRNEIYKWLRKYCKRLGIRFTPHMARHTVGKWLNADGQGLATIQAVLDHRDPRSSLRYQSADDDTIRRALAGLGKRR